MFQFLGNSHCLPHRLSHIILLLGITFTPHILAQISSIPPDSAISTPTGPRSLCYVVEDWRLACQTLTPGWSGLPFSSQASCVCFDTARSFVPTSYDNAAQTCYDGWIRSSQTADVSYYSETVLGLCTRYFDAAGHPKPYTATGGQYSDATSQASQMGITPAPTSARPTPPQPVAASSTPGVKNWGAKGMDRGGFVMWVAVGVSVATLVLMWWTESFL